ncbi:diverse immunoglobulin domain-containing protein 3.3 [Pimephales promelas]|nr:diverse immunoglobulin domain-containing protein 3.3 [Pimephales promelas]
MSDQCDLCLLGLIILSSLLTGTSGVDDDHVFISSGVNVRLSCNNALSDCKSTTWTYSSFSRSRTVELIKLGIKNKDTKRHERLSLESDCSLNIKNVTVEDYGLYNCQQFVNGRQQGSDAHVYLHVLHVSVSPSSSSSSSSQTEISPGRSVTLSCQLYSYIGFSCDYLVSSDGVELLWVNQAGVDLKTDSRYQISSSSSSSYRCIITLTTTLLNEDNNREWRCQVTLRNQLQTSVTYTVKYSAPVSSTTLTPVSRSNSEKTSSRTTATAPTQVVTTTTSTTVTARPTETVGLLYRVIVSIVEMAVFAAPTVILLQIICARRAGRKNSRHPEEIEMPAIQQ